MPWRGLLQVLLELSSTVDIYLQGEFVQRRTNRTSSILAVNQESQFLIDVKVQDRPEFRYLKYAESKAQYLWFTQLQVRDVWSCGTQCVNTSPNGDRH